MSDGSVLSLRIDDRVAIITGAGSGMGRAHAHLLASHGAVVVVNEMQRTIDRAETIVRAIEDAGGRAIPVAGTVGDDAARCLVEAAVSRYDRVDIVVNNAGIPAGGADDVVVRSIEPRWATTVVPRRMGRRPAWRRSWTSTSVDPCS
jgi:NAD(P)-dependent dehydrogenase (short-subunit alcohol dehydrogenase family)